MTSAQQNLTRILGATPGDAAKIEPLLADAAAALAEETIPSESEIHGLVGETYKFDQDGSHHSEDMDRRLANAEQNITRWRKRAHVYLVGASVLLKRLTPTLSRYEAKKRVLAALRTLHPGRGSELFYFTREEAIELPPDVPARAGIAPSPLKGASFHEDPAFAPLLGTPPERLAPEQIDVLLRLLSVFVDPRPHKAAGQTPTARIVDLLAKCGERAGPCVLEVMSHPDASAKSVEGERGPLLIGLRKLLVRLPAAWSERILRAALEAGWSEWVDRPLLDAPLESALRERLLRDHGSRQDPRGNPYRPAEEWFYSLED